MKIGATLLILFLFTSRSIGQKIIEQYQAQKDSLRIGIGKNDFLPYNEKGYTLVLPDTTNNIQGVLVSLEDKRYDLQANSNQQIYREAVAEGIAVLYVST